MHHGSNKTGCKRFWLSVGVDYWRRIISISLFCTPQGGAFHFLSRHLFMPPKRRFRENERKILKEVHFRQFSIATVYGGAVGAGIELFRTEGICLPSESSYNNKQRSAPYEPNISYIRIYWIDELSQEVLPSSRNSFGLSRTSALLGIAPKVCYNEHLV